MVCRDETCATVANSSRQNVHMIKKNFKKNPVKMLTCFSEMLYDVTSFVEVGYSLHYVNKYE